MDLAAGTLVAGTPSYASAFSLGFGQRLSNGGPGTFSIAFDDLSITLHTTPAGVPEPATFGLAAAAMLVFAWRRKSATEKRF